MIGVWSEIEEGVEQEYDVKSISDTPTLITITLTVWMPSVQGRGSFIMILLSAKHHAIMVVISHTCLSMAALSGRNNSSPEVRYARDFSRRYAESKSRGSEVTRCMRILSLNAKSAKERFSLALRESFPLLNTITFLYAVPGNT